MNEPHTTSLDRRMRRIEELIDTLEKLGNPVARAASQELMKTLLTLHRHGLERMLKILSETEGGAVTVAALGRDSLVGDLLLLHGLHPVNVETRVREAIDRVRPMIRGHGGELELVAVGGNLVRVRLIGSCSLSAQALEHALEEAFTTIAPDVQVIEVENAAGGRVGRLPLPLVS